MLIEIRVVQGALRRCAIIQQIPPYPLVKGESHHPALQNFSIKVEIGFQIRKN